MSGAELPDEPTVEVDVEGLLKKAVRLVEGQAVLRGVEICAPCAADARPFPYLPVRPLQLVVAFENLIHNAVAYSLSGPDGYESIRIEGRYADADHYAVDFTNVGLAISPAEISGDHLFAFGYRGEAARQMAPGGSGVGLSSVQRIARRHGGAIQVSSAPVAEGATLHRTTFRMVLPITHLADQGKP